MPYGLYLSAAGAEAQSRTLEVLSNNLANVDTPGFKREFAIVQARHSEAIQRGDEQAGSRSINDIGGGVNLQETVTDFSRGTIKQTGVATDLAIDDSDGQTFFVVERNGEKLLTRAGNFRFDATGQLTTPDGDRVISENGQPVAINPTLPWRITNDGVVEQTGVRLALALERPRSLGDLSKAGANLFTPLADTLPADASQRKVRDGCLEMSSAKPTQLMMDLIKTTRAFEANVRLIQQQDSVIGSLVNRVLRQS